VVVVVVLIRVVLFVDAPAAVVADAAVTVAGVAAAAVAGAAAAAGVAVVVGAVVVAAVVVADVEAAEAAEAVTSLIAAPVPTTATSSRQRGKALPTAGSIAA
jgi:hypothetical protein